MLQKYFNYLGNTIFQINVSKLESYVIGIFVLARSIFKKLQFVIKIREISCHFKVGFEHKILCSQMTLAHCPHFQHGY
jgi:hypothetical protein